MSKITNDGLTRSGTGCFIAAFTWQQWAFIRGGTTRISESCLIVCFNVLIVDTDRSQLRCAVRRSSRLCDVLGNDRVTHEDVVLSMFIVGLTLVQFNQAYTHWTNKQLSNVTNLSLIDKMEDPGGATRGLVGTYPGLFENMGLVTCPNLRRNSEGVVGEEPRTW